MFSINIKQIDSTIHTNDGSFLQTPFWCNFKARHGWTYRRFELEITYNEGEEPQTLKEEVSVLNRSFARGRFSIAYIPLFPRFPSGFPHPRSSPSPPGADAAFPRSPPANRRGGYPARIRPSQPFRSQRAASTAW